MWKSILKNVESENYGFYNIFWWYISICSSGLNSFSRLLTIHNALHNIQRAAG